MADDMDMEAHYAEMDTTAHRHTYGGFLVMLKWGTVAAIIGAIIAIVAIT